MCLDNRGSATPEGAEDGARDLAGDLAAHRADGLLDLPLAVLGGLLRLALATLGLLDGSRSRRSASF